MIVASSRPSDRVASPVAIRRAADLAEVVSGDRIVVLRLDDTDCTPHVLQGTAVAIWQHIDGRRSAEDISATLAAVYDAPLARVRADVRSCLSVLHDVGLIARVEGSV